jgi:hypothetical protein
MSTRDHDVLQIGSMKGKSSRVGSRQVNRRGTWRSRRHTPPRHRRRRSGLGCPVLCVGARSRFPKRIFTRASLLPKGLLAADSMTQNAPAASPNPVTDAHREARPSRSANARSR